MARCLTTSRLILPSGFFVSQVLGVGIAKCAGAAQFIHVKLQLPASYVFYDARSLTDDGRAGGYIRISGQIPPFDLPIVWNQAGQPLQLPTPEPFAKAYVQGFSETGDAVGNFVDGSEEPGRPVVWDGSGYFFPPHFGRGGTVWGGNATAILGETWDPAITSAFVGRITLWDADGSNPRVVAGLPDVAARPTAMNNPGTYVGAFRYYAGPQSGQVGGFTGRDGIAQVTSYPDFPIARPADINDSDWMVGAYLPVGAPQNRAFIAKAFDDEIQDLGLLSGFSGIQAHAINNEGTIVGTALAGGTGVRALIWNPGDTQPTNLNTLVNIPGETLVDAMDINNAGQILARGSGGYYIFTPIPEPAAFAAIAFATVALRRVRRG